MSKIILASWEISEALLFLDKKFYDLLGRSWHLSKTDVTKQPINNLREDDTTKPHCFANLLNAILLWDNVCFIPNSSNHLANESQGGDAVSERVFNFLQPVEPQNSELFTTFDDYYENNDMATQPKNK